MGSKHRVLRKYLVLPVVFVDARHAVFSCVRHTHQHDLVPFQGALPSPRRPLHSRCRHRAAWKTHHALPTRLFFLASSSAQRRPTQGKLVSERKRKNGQWATENLSSFTAPSATGEHFFPFILKLEFLSRSPSLPPTLSLLGSSLLKVLRPKIDGLMSTAGERVFIPEPLEGFPLNVEKRPSLFSR